MGNLIHKFFNQTQHYTEFNNDNICPICLETMSIKGTIVLDCCHKFHASCIFNSLASNNKNCPLCRDKINYKYPRKRFFRN